MADTKVGIIGAAGRMGRAITQQVTKTDGCIVVAACDKRETNLVGSDVGELAGISSVGVKLVEDASSVISAADVVIEFTLPDATIGNAKLTAAATVPHIIGTTGMLPQQLELLKQAAEKTVIMHAPNMSLLVNLLFALTKQVAATLGEEFDIEIFEMHHKHKVDAPSGTALRIGEAAAEKNVVDALETHPDLATNGDVAVETMLGVNHPNIRVNFDTANVHYYNEGVDTVEELGKVLDYVASIHLKDTNGAFKTWHFPALGEGIVNFPKVFEMFSAAGKDGPYTLEIEGMEGEDMTREEVEQRVEKSYEYLKSQGLTG